MHAILLGKHVRLTFGAFILRNPYFLFFGRRNEINSDYYDKYLCLRIINSLLRSIVIVARGIFNIYKVARILFIARCIRANIQYLLPPASL